MKPTIYLGYAHVRSDFIPNRGLLTPSQQQRFDLDIDSASDKRQRQFCASRELLNHLGELYFPNINLSVDEPLIQPYYLLSNTNQKHNFNISHSGNFIVVAIADATIREPVGVDIQTLKSGWTASKTRFFCTEQQIQFGLEHSDPDHFFTQLWSHKEAYFKATQDAYVDKHFDNDTALNYLGVDTMGESAFVSLYCNEHYQVHFQQIKL